jgi:hypothetical protein
MVAEGSAITIRAEDGRLCLIAGLQADPEQPGCVELWFGAGPGLRVNAIRALRLGRRIFETAAADVGPITVLAYVEPGRVAGGRLARALGFTGVGVRETAIGPLDVFERRF